MSEVTGRVVSVAAGNSRAAAAVHPNDTRRAVVRAANGEPRIRARTQRLREARPACVGPLLISTAIVLIACRPQQHGAIADTARDRAEILRLYEATRRAHLDRDAAGFVMADADSVVEVADGTIHVRTRAAALAALGHYLENRRFVEVADIEAPRIDVAADGRSATLIGYVLVRGEEARATGAPVPFSFTAAWVDLWRKSDGVWRIVVHANTEHDLPPSEGLGGRTARGRGE
jgi:hypothetical protein